MTDILHTVRAALDRHVGSGGYCCVAFSGGLDSTVLLHALHASWPPGQLRAVHIDHGLQADSGRWAAHCIAICRDLDVPLIVRKVTVPAGSGQGPEAAARTARYAALRELLAEGEWLLTAHHRDDQLETVLLRLLRGAGPLGLAGIPEAGPLAPGLLLRPLLQTGRDDIRRYALDQALHWIEDPANRQATFDRNFLRHQVVPSLRSRWPGLDGNVARTAQLSAEVAAMLNALADLDGHARVPGDSLDLSLLRQLPEPRQRNFLRRFLRARHIDPPGEAHLRTGLAQLLDARADGSPQFAWGDVQIRRYRDRLYLLHSDPATVRPARPVEDWNGTDTLQLGGLSGSLQLRPVIGAGLDARIAGRGLAVRLRAGGERMQPAGDRHHRSLKYLCQAAGIVPWMRPHLPLIMSGSKLVAVGDLWIAEGLAAPPGGEGLQIDWRPAAAVR